MPPTSPASQPVAEPTAAPGSDDVVEEPRARGIRALLRRLAASTLVAQVTDDYATEKSKPVPVGARVPRWHLAALWITLLGGIPTLAVGIDFYQSGYSLARALAAVAIGGCCYLAYAIPAAYLGARTGRGAALLTRAVFGSAASVVISDLLVAAGAARLAFVSTVVASIFNGLFGWPAALIAAALAVVAAAVNVFGFAGIAAVARYLAAPLLVAWAGYLVIRLILTPHVGLGAPGGPQTLPFEAGVGLAISAIAWGNEPDVWRYGKAKAGWLAAPYLASLLAGSLLIAAAGWLMASLSRGGTPAALAHGVRFSTFGVLGLAAVVITVLQIGNSSGACYQMTNAVQNLIGQIRGWRRWHTAVLVAAVGALATWAIQGSVAGFARVACWSAVVLPSVTVVMCVELLARARQPGADRSRRIKVPPLGKGGRGPNWTAIAAVLVATGYGAWGMALLPGQHAAPALGFVPAESWLLAAGLYASVVTARSGYAAARSALSRARSAARQAAAERAEAKRQAAASRAEAAASRAEEKRQAAASRVEARRQARTDRAEAKRKARTDRAEAKRKAWTDRIEAKRKARTDRAEAKRKARAKRAKAKRRPAGPTKLPPTPAPPPRPQPRDYLEAIRRDLRNDASGNPYLELVSAAAVPRGRLRDFAAEQAQARVSDRRSFLYLAARSNDQVGALFAEFADVERRALDQLTIFNEALGHRAESAAGPQRAGCRAYSAFVAWLALNAQPVDAALAVGACRPAWSASLAGIGRALREHRGYRFDEGACAFFDLMAANDVHTEDQLMRLISTNVDTGQPPVLAAGYARLLASYQAMFWTNLAAEATEAAATAD
jgi:purine-cytosine permease-like protein